MDFENKSWVFVFQKTSFLEDKMQVMASLKIPQGETGSHIYSLNSKNSSIFHAARITTFLGT